MRGGDGTTALFRFGMWARVVEPVPSHIQSDRAVRYEVGAFGPTLPAESTASEVARVVDL